MGVFDEAVKLGGFVKDLLGGIFRGRTGHMSTEVAAESASNAGAEIASRIVSTFTGDNTAWSRFCIALVESLRVQVNRPDLWSAGKAEALQGLTAALGYSSAGNFQYAINYGLTMYMYWWMKNIDAGSETEKALRYNETEAIVRGCLADSALHVGDGSSDGGDGSGGGDVTLFNTDGNPVGVVAGSGGSWGVIGVLAGTLGIGALVLWVINKIRGR